MTTNTAPALPTLADTAMMDRPFPVRDALAPVTHSSVVALLVARRGWFLELAEIFLATAEAGCPESLDDARDAFAKSETYAP